MDLLQVQPVHNDSLVGRHFADSRCSQIAQCSLDRFLTLFFLFSFVFKINVT